MQKKSKPNFSRHLFFSQYRKICLSAQRYLHYQQTHILIYHCKADLERERVIAITQRNTIGGGQKSEIVGNGKMIAENEARFR